ncbi:MAG: response regulator [Pseudomonadota bacterium]
MKSASILLVEAEILTLWALEEMLKSEGYEVCTAESGEEALRSISERDMDLVISDMELPGITGLDVLLQIRKRYPQQKVIIITSEDFEELIEKAREECVDDFIFKPFLINEVTYRVKKVLEA